MTKADIVEQVSEATGLTKVETEAVLDGVIFYIIDSLKRGERVDMRGFGSFLVKRREARNTRNPATNEINLIYPEEDESLFSSIFESFNSLKVILREFHNMPLYIMGGMYA